MPLTAAETRQVVTVRTTREDVTVDEVPQQVGGYWSGNFLVPTRGLTIPQREALAALGRVPLATAQDGDSYLHAVLGTAVAGLERSPHTDEVHHADAVTWREAFARAFELNRADIDGTLPHAVTRGAADAIRRGEAPTEVTDLFPYLTDDVKGMRVVVVAQNGLTYDVGDPDLPPLYVVYLGDCYAATVRVPPHDDDDDLWLKVKARVDALMPKPTRTDDQGRR